MSLTFTKLKIPEVILIEPKIFNDNRGFFFENYKELDFSNKNIDFNIVQENFSYSRKNVLRGLHFQIPPKEQAKFVSVTHGKIFDVAVDLRKNSSTYSEWVGEILSSENHKSLFIPEGFAHGFCVLSDSATVSYKVNNDYSPKHERGIIWNDPVLDIKWPITAPIISKKDDGFPNFSVDASH